MISTSKFIIQLANLIPRALSSPRESTLATAGHVSMYANPSRTEGGSLISFCQHCLGSECCAAIQTLF